MTDTPEPKDPVAAQIGPYQMDVEEGKRYFWCKCGLSKSQPLCDGSHKGTGINPVAFVAEATGTVQLCGCKQTDDDPFCDGTHNIL